MEVKVFLALCLELGYTQPCEDNWVARYKLMRFKIVHFVILWYLLVKKKKKRSLLYNKEFMIWFDFFLLSITNAFFLPWKIRHLNRKSFHFQVEQRAIEVWGSEEELEQERERRAEKASNSKLKQYNKKIKGES